MANRVTKAEIDELGLSPANPALVDTAEPLVDGDGGDDELEEGQGDGTPS